ncbi:tetratricopeptide repeat protein [Pelagibius sp.]
MNERHRNRFCFFWRSAFAICALWLLLLNAHPAAADFDAGMTAFENGDFVAAHDAWLPLAEAGNADAQYWIGELYSFGKGVTKDFDAALPYYLKAAYQGHGRAQYEAASLLKSGNRRDESNEMLSFSLYMRAAVNGVTSAYVSIASAYCFGIGVDEDPVIADIWMALAMGPFADRLDVMEGVFCDIFGKNDEAYLREINRRAGLLKQAYGLASYPPP